MSARLEIDDHEVVAAFERIRTGILHPQMLAAAIGRKWHSFAFMGFKTSTDPWGNAWLPLKAREGQPLLSTRRLRNSVIDRAFGADLELGTSTSYARMQQFGSAGLEGGVIRPKAGNTLGKDGTGLLIFRLGKRWVSKKQVTVPARPFLPVTRDDRVNLPETWLTGARDVTRIFFQNAADGTARA